LKIKEKREVTGIMLRELGRQHKVGGFSEFSQFSEDTLKNLVKKLDNGQLEWLMKEIEEVSDPKMFRDNF